MIPVRTAASNFVYRGPSPDIGDAWCERVPAEHAVYLDWQPSDEERQAIAAGGLVRLGIFGMEPIPPVSLNVSDLGLLSDNRPPGPDRPPKPPRPPIDREMG